MEKAGSKRKSVIKLKHGERAIKLKVTHPVRCQECKRQLGTNEYFWLDFIPYRNPYGVKTHYKKVICEACWRGPKNIWQSGR